MTESHEGHYRVERRDWKMLEKQGDELLEDERGLEEKETVELDLKDE